MQGRHRYGPAAVGYFIVSGATGADDVLAALLLARWAEAYDKRTGEVALDIAPQFESLGALERCGETMQELLAEPVVPPPSRGARPHAMRVDRILRRQQGGRAVCLPIRDPPGAAGTCAKHSLPPMSATSYFMPGAEALRAAAAASMRW